MFPLKKSLAHAALLKMGIRITIIIVIATLFSYWHIVSTLESQIVGQLEKYIVERSQREHALFQLAEDNHAWFKQDFLARYELPTDAEVEARFAQLFVEQEDGRLQLQIIPPYKNATVTGFITQETPLTPALRRRLVILYDMVTQYGSAWSNRFENLYVSLPDKAFISYQFETGKATSLFSQESWNQIADPSHNPARKSVWTGFYYDELTGNYLISCKTPIDIEGEHLITVSHDVLLNDFVARGLHDHLEGVYNMLLREDGDIVIHPRYMEQIRKNKGHLEMDQVQDVQLNRDFQLIKNLAADNHVTENAQDREFLAVAKIEGVNWYFITVYPKSLLMQLAFKTARFILMLGILSLLIEVSMLFWVLRRQIGKPLQQVVAATQQISAGNFDIQVDTTRQDELGTLAAAFNTMAQEVQQREEALRVSEERFALAMSAANDGLWDWDPQTNVAYFSRRCKEMCGFREDEEFTTDDFFKRIHREDFEQVWTALSDYLRQRAPNYDTTYRVLHRKGNYIWIRARAIADWNKNKQAVRVVGTHADITTQKCAEEALRKSQRSLAEAQRIARLGNWEWDVQSNQFLWSDEVYRIFGVQPQAFTHTYEAFLNFVHPDDVKKVKNAVKEALSQKEAYSVEHRIILPNHEIRFVRQQGEVLFNEDDKSTYMLGIVLDITERKQMEEKLRQKEEFLRLVIDNLPMYVVWKDINGIFVGCNVHVLQLNGMTDPEEIVGKSDYELVWKEEAENYIRDDRRIMDNDKSELHFIEKAMRADGNFGWVETSKIPLHDVDGKVIGILATAEDVTERERAKELLKEYSQKLETDIAERTKEVREKEAFLRLIIDNIPELVFWKDINSVYMGCNQQVALLNGLLTPTEITGKTDFDLVWHDFAEKYQADDRRVMDSDISELNFIEQVVGTNNTFNWVETNKIPLHDESGEVIGILGTARDITEQKQAEEILRQTKEFLDSVIRNLPVGLCAKDLTNGHRFSLWNNKMEELLGVPANNILGKSDHDLFSSEEAERYRNKDIQVIQQRRVTDIEEQVSTASGSFILSHTVKVPLYDDYGTPKTLLCILEDITKRKQAELELIVAKETAEQAKVQAEIANQAKSSFLANMSHELRTPLNGILGYTQILARDRSLTTKQQEGIGIIQRSGEYLLTLINDVLDLSKIEAGKIEIYPMDFNFNDFIQGITDLFRMRAQQKGITFIYEPLSSLPVGIHADEKRLRQVLINLLGNSVKFTESGGVGLKVGRHHGKIRFQIEDTGFGIAKEDLPKIFEPFQQVGEHTHKAEGTGLGLPITKKLVEMMGGELRVDSELGKGSIFWMELDLPEVEHLTKQEKKVEPLIIGFEGPPRRLFVVDDKWENRSVMINLLVPLGFQVMEAADGQEALEKVHEAHPDLIITDLVMPVLDGFELVRRLRKMPEYEQIPIIAASASVFDYHQEKSIAVGCNDFIAKPFRVEAMLELLSNHLGIKWIYEEPVAGSEKTEAVAIPAGAPLVGPTPKQAKILYELAMMGDIGGILKELEKLEKADAQLLPFTHKIRQFAKNFEEEQICKFIEPFKTAPEPEKSQLLILLAEDNAVNQKVALLLLKQLGYQADIAKDGLEVLAALNNRRYDIILMDVEMPNMNGLTATRQILEKIPAAQRPWIIAMTASSTEDDREICLQAGMNGYIPKPIRREELEAVLNRCPRFIA